MERGRSEYRPPLIIMKYLENGYIDVAREIDRSKAVFNFYIGGRGTGKTYGFLGEMYRRKRYFLFLRRTQVQLDLIARKELNPYNVLNRDNGWSILPEKVDKHIAILYENEDKETSIGIAAALSTFANVRGTDFSNVTDIVYDEFIPENHARPIKNETEAFLNLYESVNRNRELNGEEPVKCWFLANSNDINAPLLNGFNLVDRVNKMYQKETQDFYDRDRSIAIHCLLSSPISRMKKECGALYKLGAKDFEKMAIGNMFDVDVSDVVSLPIAEFFPKVQIGDITICKHKSDGRVYVTRTKFDIKNVFGADSESKMKFKKLYGGVFLIYLHGNVYFESFSVKSEFLDIFS